MQDEPKSADTVLVVVLCVTSVRGRVKADHKLLLAASPLLQDCSYYFAVGFAFAEFHDGAN
jgi:hypothetical protein